MSKTKLADVRFLSPASLEHRLIKSLFPSEVAAVAADDRAAPGGLFAEEEAAVANAVETRRQEFSRGRACARAALRQLGVEPGPIPVRLDRAPQWPAGVVGTIAHTPGLVCAAVAWQHGVSGLGVDIETRHRPIRETLDRFIRTPAERLAQQHLPAEFDWLRIVFSAKEAVHKCVAPLSGITLGFQDVELDFDVVTRSYCARLVRRDRELPDFKKLIGRFGITPRFVITTAVI